MRLINLIKSLKNLNTKKEKATSLFKICWAHGFFCYYFLRFASKMKIIFLFTKYLLFIIKLNPNCFFFFLHLKLKINYKRSKFTYKAQIKTKNKTRDQILLIFEIMLTRLSIISHNFDFNYTKQTNLI